MVEHDLAKVETGVRFSLAAYRNRERGRENGSCSPPGQTPVIAFIKYRKNQSRETQCVSPAAEILKPLGLKQKVLLKRVF